MKITISGATYNSEQVAVAREIIRNFQKIGIKIQVSPETCEPTKAAVLAYGPTRFDWLLSEIAKEGFNITLEIK